MGFTAVAHVHSDHTRRARARRKVPFGASSCSDDEPGTVEASNRLLVGRWRYKGSMYVDMPSGERFCPPH